MTGPGGDGRARAEGDAGAEGNTGAEGDAGGKRDTGARRDTGGTPTQTCERCGHQMYDRHCKVVCPNCGYLRDCSDP